MTEPDNPEPSDAEQRRAVSLLRSVDVPAPDALRARLEGMIDEADTRGRSGRRGRTGRLNARWRNTLFLPAATALAVVIVALLVLLGSGASAPSVDRVARLALSAPTAPAPPRDGTHPELLAAAVDGIPFPSYVANTGWQPSGSRTETVHERKIVIVYYRAPDGTRVGYAIVPGGSLSSPSGDNVVRGGVRYTFGRAGPGRYVTWVRGGHSCVIAGATVSNQTLLTLARADERTVVQ